MRVVQVGQAAVLFRDKEREIENPSDVSQTMLLSQEYKFLLTAFCSKIKRHCKAQTHNSWDSSPSITLG